MKTRAICAVAASLLCAAAPAGAQELGAFTLGGSAVLATDYSFRGVSQTDNDPTAQGTLTLTHDSGAYVSVFASNVDFDPFGIDDATLELDFIGGYGGTIGDFSYGVSAAYYTYPGTEAQLNYWEFGLTGSYALDRFTPMATLYWAPNYFGGSDATLYASIGLSVAVLDSVNVYGGVGKTWYEAPGVKDAVDWNIGANVKDPWLGLVFDLKYVQQNDRSYGELTEGRAILSVSKAF